MKFVSKRIMSILLILTMLMPILAVDGFAISFGDRQNAYQMGEMYVDGDEIPQKKALAKTQAQSADITLLVGDSTELFVNVKDGDGNPVTNAPIQWTASPSGVVSVLKNSDTRYATITGLSSKNSPVTVTATLGSSTKSVVVDVLDKEVAAADGTTIKLNEDKYDGFVGVDLSLNGEITAPHGTSGITLEWAVSNKNGIEIKTPESIINKDVNHMVFNVKASAKAKGWFIVAVETSNGAISRRSVSISDSQSAPDPVQIGTVGDATINIYKATSWAEGEAAIIGKGEAHTKLDDVIVEYKDKSNNKKSAIANSNYKISLDNTNYGVTLKKEGYQDYIIPSEVFRAFQYSQTADLDVYMKADKKDGKPYISSVYGRESGKKAVFTDLFRKELKVVEKETYDILLSVSNTNGKVVTYAIGQDAFHQVSNSSGVFSSQDLYGELSNNTSTKVYAFVITPDGSDAQEIKLKKFLTTDEDTILSALDDDKISLLGKDGLNLTISGTGFIDGMEFSLDAFKDLPIGFEKDGNKYKVSLGLDLFSAKKETKGSSTTGTKYKKNWEFENYKDEVKDLKRTCGEAFKEWKDDQSSKKEAYEKAKSIQKKYDKNISKVKSREKGFDVSFLGYWEFEILDGGKLVTTDIGGTLTGKYEFTYTQNGFVWVIPEYTYFAFSVTLSASINGARTVPDYNLPLELNISVNLIPKLQVGGGIGWKDIASAGFWGSAELNVLIEFMKHHTTGDVTGKFGYEATFLFIFGTKKTLLEGTLHLWDRYWGSSKKMARSAQANTLFDSSSNTVSSGETEIKPTERSYIATTSPWLGDILENNDNKKVKSNALSSGGVEFKTLQTGVFEYAQSQIVTIGNKIVMVYIEDASGRDEYNRMRLMSSVYNPITNTWSTPVAVCDDGHNDVYPSLATDGNKVYVAWQKICKTLTAQNSNTAESIVENSEIYISEFNTSTNSFINSKRITNNSVYDYSPKITVSNGTPTVYYASCLNNDMSKTSNNTISKYSGSTISILASSLNYIHNIVVSSNGKQAAYLMDEDGNVSNGSDINAYVIGNTSKVISIDKAIGDIVYAKIDGVETLLFTDQSYIYYYDSRSELRSVYVGTSDIAGGFYPFETSDGLGIMWNINNGDGSNSLWGMSYADGEWSESVCLSEQSEKLSSIAVTTLNNKMYGVVSATQVDYSEETGVTQGETSLKSFNFTDFTDVAIINTVAFEEDFAAGQDGLFDVYVKNNGTTNINSITFTVTDTLGTYSEQTISVELPSGGTQIVTLTYPVPTNYTETDLTVVASTNNSDAKPEDNSYIIKIGSPDLYFGDVIVSEYGTGYIVDTKLYNASDIPAENALIFIKYDSKDNNAAESYECSSLEKDQSIPITFTVKKEDLTFDDDNCAFVYLFIGNEEDKAVPVLLVKTTEMNCNHIHTTQNTLYTPTCTENGILEIYCSDCGKSLDTIEQIALGHSFTDYKYNNDATTKKDGTETAKCDRCDATDTRIAVGTMIIPDVFILTYNANGGTGAPARQNGNGSITLSTTKPIRSGYTFKGWATSSTATAAQYQPGTSYNLTENATLYAIWQKIDTPVNPTANAKLNVKSSTSVDYRANVTITATAMGVPDGYVLALYDGNTKIATGDNTKVSHNVGNMTASKTYTVKVIDPSNNAVQKDGKGAELSKTCEINVNTGFFARLIAFFRGLFGLLPNVEVKP